uniref:Uncharacterized protein n=1 Tax=Brassica oleracea TaxID=3712 RepID=A0A3P6AT48_BRAOL|nr:unnamed protein product [Brassica oleracea]
MLFMLAPSAPCGDPNSHFRLPCCAQVTLFPLILSKRKACAPSRRSLSSSSLMSRLLSFSWD